MRSPTFSCLTLLAALPLLLGGCSDDRSLAGPDPSDADIDGSVEDVPAALGALTLEASAEGSIEGWGWDSFGQVSGAPEGSDFTAVDAGIFHSVALTADGSVVAWGWDAFDDALVSGAPGGDGFTAVAAFGTHSLALAADGSIEAWGSDHEGEVSGTPGGGGFIAIAAGVEHSLAVTADSTVEAWGADHNGQVSRAPREAGFVAVAAGMFHSLALAADGSLEAWGSDQHAQVSGTPSSAGFKAIAAGYSHNLALRADGSIAAWGGDEFGQVRFAPGGSGFIAIAADGFHSLALTADGAIVAWGDDGEGQVSGLPAETGFTAIAAGEKHSLALKGAGDVVQCDAGSYFDGEACVEAPPGSYVASEGATEATPCAAGTYQPDAGQTECLPAPIGHYAPETGMTEALACPSGTTTIETGSSECEAQIEQTIVFNSTPPSPAYVDGGYEVSATGGDSGNPVEFSTLTAACTVAGTTVTLVAAGTCTIAADQAGGGLYLDAPQATQSFTVTDPNQPPVAAAGEDQVVECTERDRTQVSLDGSGSDDPDGGIDDYEWLDPDGNLIVTGATPTVSLGMGTHAITLRVTDDGGLTDEDQVQIVIEDTTPPELSLSVTPDELWPANHGYREIDVRAGAMDACAHDDDLVITGSVVSSDSDNGNGKGDGNTSGDIRVVRSDGTVLVSSNESPSVAFNPLTDRLELRAERGGNGSERAYTIIFTAEDPSGNSGEATATVTVPHNKGGAGK